ncbi:MAG: HEAT repeat domain-containing protein [Cyanobacteria bacterium P01_H01_bin.15]
MALGHERQHVLLAGRPGSGKSTTLQRLLLELADVGLAEDTVIPMYVQLKRDRPITDLILAEFRKAKVRVTLEQLDDWLLQDQLLLLLDGVNEIPSDERRRQLQDFRDDNPTTPMVFATRDLSVGGDLGIAKQLEMRPLSEPQMRKFVGKYLAKRRMPDQADTLLRQLKDRLREIAETPLLLKLLCDVFDPATRQIPQSKGELFWQFDQKYDRIKKDKEYVPVSENFWDFKADVLQFLAFAMIQTDDKTSVEAWYALPRDRAETLLETWLKDRGVTDPATKAKLWLKDLRRCHLLQDAKDPGDLEFHHQLFQEYYAAEYLLRLLPTLSDDQLKQNYLNLLKWTEPITLMLSLVDEEEQALRVVRLAINDVDLMLGAKLSGNIHLNWQEQAVFHLTEKINEQITSQIYTTRLLGKTCSDHAVRILVENLISEENQESLFEIAFQLSNINNQSIIDHLRQLLREENDLILIASVFVLGKTAYQDVLADLKDLLNHSNSTVREQAIEALGDLRNTAVVPDLRQALQDSDYAVRAKAVEALGKLHDETSFSALLEIVKATHPISYSRLYLRLTAAKALAKINSEKVRRELSQIVQCKDTEVEVRQHVVEALGELGESAIEDLLVAINETAIAWQAAEALVAIGDRRAVTGLIKALENSVPCEQAAYVLGELRDSKAVPALAEALEHWYPQVREEAAEALGKIGNTSVVSQLYELYEKEKLSSNSNFRIKLTIALGKLGDSRVKEDLFELLQRGGFDYILPRSDRFHLFEALEEIADSSAIPVLTNLLQTRDDQDRQQAVKLLSKLCDETIASIFINALKDKNSVVRHEAIKALEKFEAQTVLPEIFASLKKTKEPKEKLAFFELLGYFDEHPVVDKLLSALIENDDSDIRFIIIESLVKLSISSVKSQAGEALSNPFKVIFLNEGLSYSLERLQTNIGFYNHEIWQEVTQNLDLGNQNKEQIPAIGYTTNVFPNATEVKVFERVNRYYEQPPDSDS